MLYFFPAIPQGIRSIYPYHNSAIDHQLYKDFLRALNAQQFFDRLEMISIPFLARLQRIVSPESVGHAWVDIERRRRAK